MVLAKVLSATSLGRLGRPYCWILARAFFEFRNQWIHPINEPHVLIRDQRFDGGVIAQLQDCLLKAFDRRE